MVFAADNDGKTHPVVGDHRISTAVPAAVAADNAMHELTNMDLAMKLHYLKGVYYFPAAGGVGGVEGLTVTAVKTPVFRALEAYYVAAGRVRRSDSGRPAVKCNDSGVRIVEAKCGATLDEWLREAAAELSCHRQLAPEEVIGPEIHFSPLVYVQFTRFKCGGLAVGVSWAHVLSDAVSVAGFMSMWAQIVNGDPAPRTHRLHNPPLPDPEKQAEAPPPPAAAAAKTEHPLSTKQVSPVEEIWISKNEFKMESFSFHVSGDKLKHLQSKISGKSQILPFEAVSAMFWQCLAKIRENREPKTVTICRANPSDRTSGKIFSNQQMIGTVRSEISPARVELSELATLFAEGFVDEDRAIEGQIDRETGAPDLIVYGANLTFVDLEEIDLYGLELKGQKPVLVNYSIGGVGDEGAVLVFHGPKSTSAGGEEDGGGGGRMVHVILPEEQLLSLRKELEREWGVA